MKHFKSSIILVFGLLTVLSAGSFGMGSSASHTIRFGFYNPVDAKAGIALGYIFGKPIDEMVAVGVGGDLYFKSYVKETVVATEDTLFSGEVQTIEREMDFSSYLLPLHATIMVDLPMDVSGFTPYITGDLGFSFLINREVNYLTDESDTKFFAAFTWCLGGGMKYQLGSSSSALFELYYNNAKLKNKHTKTDAGLPVYNEINMSGLGFRIGLQMEL